MKYQTGDFTIHRGGTIHGGLYTRETIHRGGAIHGGTIDGGRTIHGNRTYEVPGRGLYTEEGI